MYFSFDTGEECRQTLDFSVVAFLKSRVLRNSRYFIGCQHNAEPQQHIVRECHQSKEQQGCLHKCRKADSYNLLTPLIEAIGISSRYAEHIQRADRYLNEQNAAALDIGEKHLDHAVGEGDHAQQIQKTVGCRDRR